MTDGEIKAFLDGIGLGITAIDEIDFSKSTKVKNLTPEEAAVFTAESIKESLIETQARLRSAFERIESL